MSLRALNGKSYLILVLVITINIFGLTQSSDAKVIPNAYIVQVADTVDLHEVAGKAARFTGGSIGHVYSKALRGFSIRVPPGITKAQILAQPGVVLVEPDLEVKICAQTLPTGVNRIDVDLNNTAKIDGIDERVDVDIAIIDTGIDIDHPDLYVVGGRHFYTVTTGPPSQRGPHDDNNYDDDHGHGSHVAGIAAALDNNIGVVGVAPGARLWAVKVLDASGSGYLSDAIAGVDWVTERASQIEVVNMSLSATGTSGAFRAAIQNSVAVGIVYVVAAGNDAKDVYGSDGTFNTGDDIIPAAYPEAAAISAMADSDGKPGGLGGGSDDSFASFSNFSRSVAANNPVNSPGAAIDLLMPGVNIYSTWKNGGYNTISGTSMASPHAAGLAALYIAINGRAIGAAGVYAIRQAMIDNGVAQNSAKGLALLNDPDTHWENIGWAGPKTVNQRSLTTSAIAGGTVITPGIGTYLYDYNTYANIAATANANYHFVNWTGTAVTVGKVSNPNLPSTTVLMDANYAVQSNFAIDKKSLTTSASAGGTVTTPGIGTYLYDFNTTANIAATANTNYHFVNWTGTAVTTGKVSSPNSPSTTVLMDANYTVMANFAIDKKSLTTSVTAGGTVTTPGIGTYLYDYNTYANIVASANANYHFVNWTGTAVTAGKVSNPNSPGTTVLMDANYTVMANFAIDQKTISGHVTEPDANIPVTGVSIDASNGGGSDITDANGYYELTVAYGWSGTVIPGKTGYTFEPNSIDYNNVTTNQNDSYIAILDTFIISGYAVDSTLAPLAGVLVAPDNNGGPWTSKYYGGGTDTTDANGYYEVVVDYNWSGNIVPSEYTYAFEPNSIAYTNVTVNIADQNYVGTLLTYKITGYIKNSCEVPLKDIHADANNGGSSYITDVNGYYEVWVDYNWSGTVTLSKAHYTFDPNSKTYTDILEDKTGQDYLANNIYDLDCDGYIGFGDVKIISENWLETGENILGDIYKDENNIVNFLDFADFAAVWLED